MVSGGTTPGPVTLALVVVAAAILAVLLGWVMERGKQGRGLIAGVTAFVVLAAGGLFAVSRPSTPRETVASASSIPMPSPSHEPLVKYESARAKAPSVGASDFMMMWMVPTEQRLDLCIKRMKHFAQDCRDAVDGMKEMSPPTLPDDLRKELTDAVKGRLHDRDASDLADKALTVARAGLPDEMLSFPSPGGVNADILWCGDGIDDAGRHDRANRNALAIASRAGLKLPGNVVIGRVRLVRTGEHVNGDVVEGDIASPAAQAMLGLVRRQTGNDYTPGGNARGVALSFYTCK